MTAAPEQRPAASAARAGDTAWRRSWAAALDRVELDVDAAERLLGALHAGAAAAEAVVPPVWAPPALTGPVPDEHAERARLLLQRQLDVSEQLARALVHTRTQVAALRKLERAEPQPVFVDRAL
ncbi:hypothetical protein [Kineococcus arenarius]|uniref:hypothetical protein n=1 Tax=unclassified Kineococcus TaxID=2621656 RepID=UPI003D7EFBA9